MSIKKTTTFYSPPSSRQEENFLIWQGTLVGDRSYKPSIPFTVHICSFLQPNTPDTFCRTQPPFSTSRERTDLVTEAPASNLEAGSADTDTNTNHAMTGS